MFKKALKFLSIMDYSGKAISITNVALIVVISKIALSPVFDWPTAAALLLSLLNYSHRRYESNRLKPEVHNDDLHHLHSRLNDLQAGQEEYDKVLEEAKSLVSKANLAMGFRK